MRRWIDDTTGRFKKRPYYSCKVIDRLAERRGFKFLRERYGRVSYPISTEDLTVLVEQYASNVDFYCNFAAPDIEGSTTFCKGEKPKVRISRALMESRSRENRLRFTIGHELGHIILHACLYAPESLVKPDGDRFGECCPNAGSFAESFDWREWQAGYFSAALLIPSTLLDRELRAFKSDALDGPFEIDSPRANEFTRRVASRFATSVDCARRRLEMSGITYYPLSDADVAAILAVPQQRGLVHCATVLPRIVAPLGLRVDTPDFFL